METKWETITETDANMECLPTWRWYLFIIISEEIWGICGAESAGIRYSKSALVKISKNFKNAIKNVLKKVLI